MPEVFLDMELEDFSLMQKGFFNKRKSDQIQFANIAFCVDAIGTGLAGKRANYSQFIKAWFGEKPKIESEEDHRRRSEEIRVKLDYMKKLQDEKDKIKKQIQSADNKMN